MMILSNNIVELAKATWNLFCLYPGYCIIMLVAVVVGAFACYCIIKDLILPDKGGPIILR